MNADKLIEEIQKMPPEEIQKLGTFVDGLLSNQDINEENTL